MTVLDLNPRLAAARRRHRAERLSALGSASAELVAAQLRLVMLPTLFGFMLLEELARYVDAAAHTLGTGRAASSATR